MLPRTALSTSEKAIQDAFRRAYSTVLAWGRNLEGQAGIENTTVVSRPTPLLELYDQPVVKLAASKLTSAALVEHDGLGGELFTFGDGSCGKLGQGHTDTVHSPSRVEALVGRAEIDDVALGDHHSLMLDRRGQIWACGETKEGQCGLGTPLEVLAQLRHASFRQTQVQSILARRTDHNRQHSRQSHMYDHQPTSPSSHSAGQRSIDDKAAAAVSQRVKAMSQQPQSNTRNESSRQRRQDAYTSIWASHQQQTALQASGLQMDVIAAVRHAAVQQQQEQGRSTVDASIMDSHADQQTSYSGRGAAGFGMVGSHAPSAALAFGGSDLNAHLIARGAQPGHLLIPARLGRDHHPLASLGSGPSTVMPDQATAPVYKQIAAARHYSLALDTTGQIWSFGACFNGALGSSGNSWISTAQKIDGELQSVLEGQGGATHIAAGGTFGLALTESGKVVIWGTVPGNATLSTAQLTNLAFPGMSAFSNVLKANDARGNMSRVSAGLIPGLPPIKHVAAGQQHALLSDGQKVWIIGRLLTPCGTESLSAPWRHPLEVLDVGDAGVRCVRAGMHSSAVITGTGDLWMWGRIMDATYASMLLRKETFNSARASVGGLDGPGAWEWAGFGAAQPTKVDGLPGNVLDVALGGWHALALID